MNLSSIMKKLQRAILQTRLVIKISTNQFYSEEQGRMITIWILSTPVLQQDKHGEWKTRDYEILRSASGIEIVKCLQEIWEAVKGWEPLEKTSRESEKKIILH